MGDRPTLFGALSVAITVAAYWIYISQTKKGGVQPHPFSWLLWFSVTAVVFLIQWPRGGLPGSLVTGFTAVVCLVIGILTFFKNKWVFTWFDWLCLGMGGGALIWYGLAIWFSLDPWWLAVSATIADVIGYGPTIKKGWVKPHSEGATSFFLNGVKFAAALPALAPCSVTTCIYPITIAAMNSGVTIFLLVRRRQLRLIAGALTVT